MGPTTTKTFDIGVADGTFQPVVSPGYLKAILIQLHNGIKTDFTSFQDNPLGFHFSTSGDEDGKDYIDCVGELQVEMGTTPGTVVGYVRAAAGGQFSGAVVS